MRKGLGKGLAALIQDPIIEVASDSLMEIDINKIEPNPNQPRKSFNKEALEELSTSITEFGIIQPIVVRESHGETGTYYSIIAGERRYRAARIAKLSTIPCIVKSYNEMEALHVALIENIQRQNLNPIEEAMCYKQLEEYFFNSREEIATKVGKSRNTISSRINLLSLNNELQGLIMQGDISASHALKLSPLEGDVQINIAHRIINENLTIKETETILESLNKPKEINKPSVQFKTVYKYKQIETNLKEVWGTKVNIKDKGDKGKIEIEYYSNEDLDRIVTMLGAVDGS